MEYNIQRHISELDILLDMYLKAESKLATEDTNLLRIKFFSVKEFLRWAEKLDGDTDFQNRFKDKLSESMKGLIKDWEEQDIEEELQLRFMKVHEPNTSFWLKRMLIQETFSYPYCVTATYVLLQRTLTDYNKVKVLNTFANLHSVIGGR